MKTIQELVELGSWVKFFETPSGVIQPDQPEWPKAYEDWINNKPSTKNWRLVFQEKP